MFVEKKSYFIRKYSAQMHLGGHIFEKRSRRLYPGVVGEANCFSCELCAASFFFVRPI